MDIYFVPVAGGPADNSAHVPRPRPHPLANYDYNSGSMLLCELRDLMLSPGFSSPNAGLRGLVSTNMLSDDAFQLLRPWEVPGLLYDFGHHHSLAQIAALLTRDLIKDGAEVPERFTLAQINQYVSSHFAPTPARGTHDSVEQKISVELGDEFYTHYQWADPSARPLGPLELADHTRGSVAEFMDCQIASWPSTIVPIIRDDMKYYSAFAADGREFVCRSLSMRQRNLCVYTERSELFSCEICKCLIGTDYHTFVFCYVYQPNPCYQLVKAWKDTYLRCCYIHFKLANTKLPGRNCYRDAYLSSPAQFGGQSNSRGGARFARRGRPVYTLF